MSNATHRYMSYGPRPMTDEELMERAVWWQSLTAERSLPSATARIFWLDTEGGKPGDGAWYWVRLDASGEPAGESEGPFESASAAARSAARCNGG